MLEGGVNVVQRTRSTRSVFVPRGGLGEQACCGGAMLRRNFLSPRDVETCDFRAKIKEANCSSLVRLDILFIYNNTRRKYKPAVAVE